MNTEEEPISKNLPENCFQKRHTQLFNDTDALIYSIKEYDSKIFQDQPKIQAFEKPINRKTLHFENDEYLDVTNQTNDDQMEEFLHRPTKLLSFDNHQNLKPIEKEFIRMEKEAEEESPTAGDHSYVNEMLKDASINTVANQKRTTLNITPNLPESKKLQYSSHKETFSSKNKSSIREDMQIHANDLKAEHLELEDRSFMQGLVPFTEICESFTDKQEKSNIETTADDLEQTLTNANTENHSRTIQEPTTPLRTKTKTSQIPIYTGSAKKKNIARISSPNMKSVLNLDFSLQTIETARFVASSDICRTAPQDGNATEFNLSNKLSTQKRSIFEIEDKPITISDVSEHYMSQKERRTPGKRKNKNDTFMKSLMEISDSDEIDKTKLELVQSLIDQTFVEELDKSNQQNNHSNIENVMTSFQNKNTEDEEELPCNLVVAKTEDNNNHASFLCRKCKRCQGTTLNETSSTETNESFVMPKMPSLDELRKEFFNNMEKMRKGPTLAMAYEFHERMKLKHTIESLNISIDEGIEEEDDIDEDPFIKEYKELSEQVERDLEVERLKPVIVKKSFVSRLKELMSAENARNWIVNTTMIHSNILKFRHKLMYTFSIILQFERRDPFGDEVIITDICLEDSSVPKRIWVPFDFMVHFQLQLEFPYSLRSHCTGNSETNVYETLLKVDEVCGNIVKMCKELWRIVYGKGSELIRENGRTIIRKVMRKVINNSDGLYQSTQKSEYRIEVTNIKKLCFKDIIMPAVYMFREDIENLPAGLDFLHIFLKNPANFLKE